jgi:hypothetical protein
MKRTILMVIASMAIPCTATAANYPHRAALISQSNSSGVGRDTVTLLQRQAGPGVAAVGSKMVARWAKDLGPIATAGDFTTRQVGNDVHYLGKNGWRLLVRADGTSVDYQNDAYRAAHRGGVPAASAPTLSQLSAWGRQFIATNLPDVITLAKNEALVEHRALFLVQGAASEDVSQPVNSEVTGAIVVFSRTVDGVDVIGNGSKVAISFGNDGVAYGFRYDWPTYTATNTQQQTLSVAQLRQRDSAFLAIASRSIGATSEVERYFECGYFDVGARHHDPSAPVQTGCFWQRVQHMVGDAALNKANPNDGLLTTATADVIPAGVNVLADKAWPQAFFASTGRMPPATAIGSGRNE